MAELCLGGLIHHEPKDITAKPATSARENRTATTRGTFSPTLLKNVVGGHREIMNIKDIREKGAYGLQSLFKKT